MEVPETHLQGLVVDDNASNRIVAAEMLEIQGIAAEEATDGYAGWARLREKKFDVVLLDLNMPGIDGRTVCRNARKHALNSETYIVAYTAEGSSRVEELMAAGFDGLLTKPISLDDLAEAVKHMQKNGAAGSEPVGLDFVA